MLVQSLLGDAEDPEVLESQEGNKGAGRLSSSHGLSVQPRDVALENEGLKRRVRAHRRTHGVCDSMRAGGCLGNAWRKCQMSQSGKTKQAIF